MMMRIASSDCWFQRTLLASCVALSFGRAAPAFADTVVLKDGTRYEGTVTQEGNVLVVSTFDGKQVRVSQALVHGTVSDPLRNEFYKRFRALKNTDAAGHFELGNWADQNKLRREALKQFERVLELDPAHAGAGRALNYELREGRWQLPEALQPRIGAKPQSGKSWDTRRDELRAAAARLQAAQIGEGPWERDASALKLAADVAADPELFARLLIPPGMPGAVPGATTVIRARAAVLLGWAQDRRALEPLLNSAVYDPEEKVRAASARALRQLEEPVALRKLTDIAVARDLRAYPWAIRKQAAQALRRYGDKEAVERLLREFALEVAGGNPRDEKNKLRAVGRGLGTDNPLGMPENTAVPGLSEYDLYPALAALKELTGQRFDKAEKDVKTWLTWWRGVRDTFQFASEGPR